MKKWKKSKKITNFLDDKKLNYDKNSYESDLEQLTEGVADDEIILILDKLLSKLKNKDNTQLYHHVNYISDMLSVGHFDPKNKPKLQLIKKDEKENLYIVGENSVSIDESFLPSYERTQQKQKFNFGKLIKHSSD